MRHEGAATEALATPRYRCWKLGPPPCCPSASANTRPIGWPLRSKPSATANARPLSEKNWKLLGNDSRTFSSRSTDCADRSCARRTSWDLSPDRLRQAVSVSLRLANAPAIKAEAEADKNRPATYNFPADASALAGDPSWATALDLLRQPRDRGETIADWRVRAKIRPVTFDDPDDLADKAVQLHLEHRIVQRLLARFTSQGLLHLDLSRGCLASTAGGDVRAILLGRLSLFGPAAARLHEEIIPVTARWSEPSLRRV